jgi:hypothetical protein
MTMRFTIRDLLWLMVVVGLVIGWRMCYVRSEKRLEVARQLRWDTIGAAGVAASAWALEVNHSIEMKFPAATVSAKADGSFHIDYRD